MIKNRVKQIKIFAMISALFTTILLVGCGKKIPECGDQAIQGILKNSITKGVKDDLPTYEQAATGILKILNAQLPLAPDLFQISGVTANPDNLKFEAFSSTQKDKDSGMNYCTAIESGDISVEIKFVVSNQYANATDLKQQVANIADEFNKNFIPTFKANAQTKTSEFKSDGNTLVLRFTKSLPATIVYQAILTDRGDQLLVNVTENK